MTQYRFANESEVHSAIVTGDCLTLPNGDILIEADPPKIQSSMSGRGIATCSKHLEAALLYMDKRNVSVKAISDPQHYTCSCRNPATFFLREVEVAI